MDGDISEIDDPNFFFSPQGKENAAAELNATLEAFFNDTRDDDNASLCRFPARKAWLAKELSITQFPHEPTCKEYTDTLQRLSPTSATLVFPAAHINSPASMFGHTFLRVNSKYNSKLLAYAINYAADADQKKENGFTFAIKGLTGGYFGRYSLLPYYDKLKEYRDTEKRDIWEYNLNLTQEETLAMVRHIWELNGTHSYYYFFTENCSYNMLWLLEVARPSVHLREHFLYQVIPLESVHAVKEEGLIASDFYRPSKRSILLKYEELLDDEHIQSVKQMLSDDALITKTLQNTHIPLATKQYMFEAALEYLEYSYSRNDMDKKTYLHKFHLLSSTRSKLGRSKELHFDNPQNPLKGHRAVRIGLGSLYRDEQFSTLLNYRMAYHSLDDPQYGFLRGTQIEFLDATLSVTKEDVELEQLTILSIESIAQRSAFFSPFSWRTRFGWDRDYTDTEADFLATVGAGLSWGNRYGYLFVSLDPLYYIADKSALGIGGTFSLNIDAFEHSTTNLELTQRFYETGKEQFLLSFAQSINFTNNLRIQFKYDYKEKYILEQKTPQNSYSLLFHYYF